MSLPDLATPEAMHRLASDPYAYRLASLLVDEPRATVGGFLSDLLDGDKAPWGAVVDQVGPSLRWAGRPTEPYEALGATLAVLRMAIAVIDTMEALGPLGAHREALRKAMGVE